jgi:hypothetical protein
MFVLDEELLGEMLSDDGWNDAGGQAARYKSSDSDYRTWRPTVSELPEGGLLITTKIDHIRGGGGQDDHCQLNLEFDTVASITGAQTTITIQGAPQFDTGLVRAVGELDGAKTGKLAEITAKVFNSLVKFFESRAEHGGRLNFPAVIKHNLNSIAACLKPPSERPIYEVTVVTGDIENAGTGADVCITLFGANGDSGEVPLENARNNFERGQKDGFLPARLTTDLGELERIEVWHNQTGNKPGWFLEEVTIRNRDTGQTWRFPCRRWFALDADDGLIHRSLLPDTALCTYTVTIVTGDIENAGTGAEVYITLFGGNGDSGERQLVHPRNDFERGHTDYFTFHQMRNLGELHEVRIRHNDRGEKPGWFLDGVTVRNETTGETWFFPCGRWLARTADDGEIQRTLRPEPRRAPVAVGSA